MYLYTARNLTHAPPSYFATAGLYIRLRGGFYSTDKLSFIFTAVKNVSLGQSVVQWWLFPRLVWIFGRMLDHSFLASAFFGG